MKRLALLIVWLTACHVGGCLRGHALRPVSGVPTAAFAPQAVAEQRPSLTVYDALRYESRPASRKLGMTPAVLETWVPPGETVVQSALRWAAQADRTHGILILDFEPLPDHRDRQGTEQWCRDVLGIVRAVRGKYPQLRIGHYHIPIDPAGEADRALVAELDFSVPELYVFPGQTHEQWCEMVDARVAVARRHAKPVIGIVNPHYTVPPYTGIEPKRLAQVRDYLVGKVDALILWGGSDDGNKDDVQDTAYRVLPWDKEAAGAVKVFTRKAG